MAVQAASTEVAKSPASPDGFVPRVGPWKRPKDVTLSGGGDI
ncbi:MAG: hypothetical protein ACR2KQ_08770 [Actinomycetota bacterium]